MDGTLKASADSQHMPFLLCKYAHWSPFLSTSDPTLMRKEQRHRAERFSVAFPPYRGDRWK